MTTKPKARKFRIRRSEATPGASAPPPSSGEGEGVGAGGQAAAAQTPDTAPENLIPRGTEDGFGNMALPGSAAHERAEAERSEAEQVAQEIAAIRAEGLTGRQLRLARRIAQKNGMNPASDFDAVRQLRAKGIDPFGQSSMLDLVAEEAGIGPGSPQPAAAGGRAALPVRAATAQVPAGQIATAPGAAPAGALSADERAAEIMRVQKEIANRRRRRLVQLTARLAFFVVLPTMLVSFYYYAVATPLYATHTEFVIQKAESGGSAPGGLGGLLGGTSFATVQESITVQSYLESREAMLRLDEELGFRAHFSDPALDPILRLDPDASVERMYQTYLGNLTIGYDPTEGLIRLEVLATDPQTSQDFSTALIRYAEERVGQMSERLQNDQMAGALEAFQEAERRSTEAQMRVLELQEQRGVLSADAEVSQVFSQIASLESRLTEERLSLAEIQASPRPNPTRVQVAEANIGRLEELIAELRDTLTSTNTGEASLAQIQSELVIAQADLETRRLMLTEAMQAMEGARMEANRQSLYVSIGVFPVAPDEAAYPKAFEKTLLAFVVFSGIYLLVSMTASILREQVSS